MNFNEATNVVLTDRWIREAVRNGTIAAECGVPDDHIQPNSLDLAIGSICYRIQCSFLPGSRGVNDGLRRLRWYDFIISENGTVLERDQVYLIPLAENLKLPRNVSGRANAKSTTGRLDIFTRLVTEHGSSFDHVSAGYEGRLYLEVVPRSFPIVLRPGDALAQLRFQNGDPVLSDNDIAGFAASAGPLVGPDAYPIPSDGLPISGGVFLSVDLESREGAPVAYRARRNAPPVDLRCVASYPWQQYWDSIHTRPNDPIILEPDEFYIFGSRERLRIPPTVCAELVPFDASRGEMRVHYAGFIDSGFGHATTSGPATLVLEIRNRDVPFLLEDGDPLFRLLFLRNDGIPERSYGEAMKSSYQSQSLRLAKQFRMEGV